MAYEAAQWPKKARLFIDGFVNEFSMVLGHLSITVFIASP
jgi:hypothetical protein